MFKDYSERQPGLLIKQANEGPDNSIVPDGTAISLRATPDNKLATTAERLEKIYGSRDADNADLAASVRRQKKRMAAGALLKSEDPYLLNPLNSQPGIAAATTAEAHQHFADSATLTSKKDVSATPAPEIAKPQTEKQSPIIAGQNAELDALVLQRHSLQTQIANQIMADARRAKVQGYYSAKPEQIVFLKGLALSAPTAELVANDTSFCAAAMHFMRMAKAADIDIPSDVKPLIVETLAAEYRHNTQNNLLNQNTIGSTTASYGIVTAETELEDYKRPFASPLTAKMRQLKEAYNGDETVVCSPAAESQGKSAETSHSAAAKQFIASARKSLKESEIDISHLTMTDFHDLADIIKVCDPHTKELAKTDSTFRSAIIRFIQITDTLRQPMPAEIVPAVMQELAAEHQKNMQNPAVNKQRLGFATAVYGEITDSTEIPAAKRIRVANASLYRNTIAAAPPTPPSGKETFHFRNQVKPISDAARVATPVRSASTLNDESPLIIDAKAYLADLRKKVTNGPDAAKHLDIINKAIPQEVVKDHRVDQKIDSYALQGTKPDVRLKQALARVFMMSELADKPVPQALEKSIIDILNHEMAVNAGNPQLDQRNRSSITAVYGTATEGKFHVLKKTSANASFPTL